MRKTTIKKELELISDRNVLALEAFAAQVREKEVIPICNRLGLVFYTGNGGWWFEILNPTEKQRSSKDSWAKTKGWEMLSCPEEARAYGLGNKLDRIMAILDMNSDGWPIGLFMENYNNGIEGQTEME